jgi:hypothetical protein
MNKSQASIYPAIDNWQNKNKNYWQDKNYPNRDKFLFTFKSGS